MFGIGFPELILILALALIVVGPDKLPDLARSVAKTLMDLKKTAEELKGSLDQEDNPLSEIKPELEDAAKNFKETILDAESKTWKGDDDAASTPEETGQSLYSSYADMIEAGDKSKSPDPDKSEPDDSDSPTKNRSNAQPQPSKKDKGQD